MNIKFVHYGDSDYPYFPMELVSDKDRYTILKIEMDGKRTYLVPLSQVIDKMMIKSDAIIKDGVRICPNCGAQMGVVE